MLVFVEVKARRTLAEAAEAAARADWSRIEAAASVYAATAPRGSGDMRFDVVLLGACGGIERIENATL